MIADWIDAELRNWAAWCWSGSWPHPIPPDHAESLEGSFVRDSALDGEEEQAEQVRRPPAPNRRHAEIVHQVYMTHLTDRERWVLVYKYVRPHTMEVVLRRLRIGRREWEVALMAAARCVGEAFREGAKWPS